MSVFVDVTNACRSAQNTGMQRMTRSIFAELNQATQVRPVSWNTVGNVYTDLGETEYQLLTRPFEVRSHPSARPEFRGQDPFTEAWRLLRRRRINLEREIGPNDVFLVPDIFRDRRRIYLPGFLRTTRARKVAIFHDATDLRLSSVYGDRSRKSRPYVEALSLFDLVICVSKEARDDLHYYWKSYGCNAAETVVEPWPGDFITSVEEPDSFLPDQNSSSVVVIYISSFHGRKNHLTLLRAAEKLWRRGIHFQLRLIGRNVGAPFNKIVREIWKLRIRGRPVRWLRHVNDRTLCRAYRDCRFTVYPSLMEGFGLPIAESLSFGKPCVCGGNGALGEIAKGGGCLIVDQTSDEALSAGMNRLLVDQAMYARLAAEARARTFRSWSEYTAKLLEHFQLREQRPSVATVSGT